MKNTTNNGHITPHKYINHYPTGRRRSSSNFDDPFNYERTSDGGGNDIGNSASTSLDNRQRVNNAYTNLSLRMDRIEDNLKGMQKQVQSVNNHYVALQKVTAEEINNNQGFCGSESFCIYFFCCGYFC